jgi:hypothetical protein
MSQKARKPLGKSGKAKSSAKGFLLRRIGV